MIRIRNGIRRLRGSIRLSRNEMQDLWLLLLRTHLKNLQEKRWDPTMKQGYSVKRRKSSKSRPVRGMDNG